MDFFSACFAEQGPPVVLAALMPPDSPQAAEAAQLCAQHGAKFLGAKADLAEFTAEELAELEAIVSQKGNRKMFSDHLGKAPKLKWSECSCRNRFSTHVSAEASIRVRRCCSCAAQSRPPLPAWSTSCRARRFGRKSR